MEVKDLLQLVVPKEILKCFDLVEVKEGKLATELIFEEKKELIPVALTGQVAVLDGFCNPLSLLGFPLKGNPTYIVLIRRRWKPKGGDLQCSNEYSFHPPHVKATTEFAAFLKGVHGHTPDEYLRTCGINGD